MEWRRMHKMRRKLPKGVQVRKNGTLLICYKNEFGKISRENTGQSDVRAAELMLAQARTDVAMKKRFKALSFESVRFIDLFNDWWINHGSRTRSKFQYRTPRVIARFEKKKAREVSPDAVRDFLADLRREGLAASSINQCRTILCSVFNYAIRFEKYDKNPVRVVAQEKEPPGRDRFPEPEEIVAMIRVCEEKRDLELKAFLILAPTTGMRKGEILARKWTDIDLDSKNPSIYVRITKNREPKRVQLPDIAIDALRALPSYGHHEYVFPAKANPRFRGNFKKPHAWDLGKRFRRVAEAAGIKQLRIHDLRHFTASTLTSAGVADNIISLLTGHKSRELRRYQHLREDLKRGTVDLIAKTIEEAQRNTQDPNGASSAHPLHTEPKAPKSRA
jgi:integrase